MTRTIKYDIIISYRKKEDASITIRSEILIMEKKKEKTKLDKFMDKYYKWMLLGAMLFLCFSIVVPKGRIVKVTIVIPEDEEVETVPMTPELEQEA